MNNAEQHLRTAYSYLLEIENNLPELENAIKSHNQIVNSGSSLLSGFKGKWDLSKMRNNYLKDLDLAENEINQAERLDKDIEIEVTIDNKQLTLSVNILRAICYYDKAMIHFTSGNLNQSKIFFNLSLKYDELANTYFMLGFTYLELKKPNNALLAFKKCIEVDSENEIAIEARKDIARLESKKIFGKYWFVGSWKIAGFLIFMFCVSLIIMTSDFKTCFTNILIWGGILFFYLRTKLLF